MTPDREGTDPTPRRPSAGRPADAIRAFEPDPIDVVELGRYARRYVAMVAVGTRVPIVENDVVVAYLVEPETGSRFERLKALGHVRPASGRLSDLPPPPPEPQGAKSLSETLQEMRDEERY